MRKRLATARAFRLSQRPRPQLLARLVARLVAGVRKTAHRIARLKRVYRKKVRRFLPRREFIVRLKLLKPKR